MRLRSLFLTAALAGAGCTGASGSTPAPTSAPPTAAATVAATPAPTLAATPTLPATVAPSSAASRTQTIVIAGGVATINPDALAPLVFVPPVAGSADPFYHIHTTPGTDGFFLSIVADTKYGPKWTGQLGTFAIECTPAGTGICVHFDPDGPGPLPNLGKDFKASGLVTFTALSAGGFDVTVENARFSDGTTVAGPLRLRSR